MTRIFRWFPVVVALLLLPACGAQQKKAAEAALSAAESAYSAIAAQATNLAPDEAQGIEAALASARASLAQGDYKSALTVAQDAQARIKVLADGMPALAEKLKADWKTLADSVPGALAQTRRKLEGFGKPPAASPERPKYDGASAQLTQLEQQWEQAGQLASQGKLAQAIAQGEQVRSGMVQVLSALQAGS